MKIYLFNPTSYIFTGEDYLSQDLINPEIYLTRGYTTEVVPIEYNPEIEYLEFNPLEEDLPKITYEQIRGNWVKKDIELNGEYWNKETKEYTNKIFKKDLTNYTDKEPFLLTDREIQSFNEETQTWVKTSRELTQEEIKQDKIKRLKEIRDIKMYEPFEFIIDSISYIFDADKDSQYKIFVASMTAKDLLAHGSFSTDFFAKWTLYNNSKKDLTIQDIINLHEAIMIKSEGVFAFCQEKEEDINNDIIIDIETIFENKNFSDYIKNEN